MIVKPDTVIRWHRKGFRLYWRSISKRGPGRPPISEELQALIRRLASENHWRARKIQAELRKLGFTVDLATVSRYLPKRAPDPGRQQRWMTFLHNHKHGITAMDFFVVPTVGFRLLYVWFIIDHGRRRIVHFDVTANATAPYVTVINEGHLQQLLREYVYYYNTERVHTRLQDSPEGRPVESRPSANAKVVGLPRVGDLHHRYLSKTAA